MLHQALGGSLLQGNIFDQVMLLCLSMDGELLQRHDSSTHMTQAVANESYGKVVNTGLVHGKRMSPPEAPSNVRWR
jgi:hypothetical protein